MNKYKIVMLALCLIGSLKAQITWTCATANAQWSARLVHTSVIFDNKIWVIGGYDGSWKNDVWYSSDGVNWIQATAYAQWLPRGGHSSVVFDNKMWVIGGSYPGGDVWYSSDGVTWIQATANPSWSSRYGHTSVVYDNKLWMMGGLDNNNNRKNDVWYSSDGVNWTQATANAGWSARNGHTSAIFNNKMWVIGGRYFTNNFNDVWYSTGLNGIEDNRQTLTTNRFLLNAEPNPFKTHTAIRYSLSAASNVRLSIYDNSGKLIKNLVNEYKLSGDYNITWDGKDEHEQSVSHGIYFVKVQGGNNSQIEKIVVVR